MILILWALSWAIEWWAAIAGATRITGDLGQPEILTTIALVVAANYGLARAVR